MKSAAALILAAAAFAAAPAHASELFGGVYAHDVDLVTASGIEDGVDFQVGWRGDPILPFIGGPRPHAFVSVNSAGDTNFAAAGVSWKLGGKLYVRPGIGLAVHTGSSHPAFGSGRIDYGSRVLFEPELGVGVEVSDRMSLEASWVHLSHAKLFGPNNPGLDTIGLRLNLRI